MKRIVDFPMMNRKKKKIMPAVNHRFQERNDEEDEEEGIVSDAIMVE
ncbi:MAG: hypothetical protein JSY10_27550 [Paenibacillus sp.]|nr:hypothetical protein [Paenibacillus sp.]